MPRNSSGVYSQPSGTAAVSGQPIGSAAYNTLITDIGTEITGSVPRSGTAAMLAPLTLYGADPVNANHAARKSYVDDKAGAATPADGSVTTAKVASHAVTPAKIDLGAWTNVASASTVDLGAQTSRNLVITGTTAITSFGTTDPADGLGYTIRFAAALTLTNGANLVLPGAANITTAAGDTMRVVYEGSSVWRIISYMRAANALVLPQTDWTTGTSTTESPISPSKLSTTIEAKAPVFGAGQDVQTTTRSLATVYQNTSGKPVNEFITVLNSGGSAATFVMSLGKTSPPGEIARAQIPSGTYGCIPLLVPADWYFSIDGGTGISIYESKRVG